MRSDRSQSERPHHDCPRCGYDLSGEIETWQEECPVWGVCSECGLGFEWGGVLHPTRRVPRWFVEHPQGFGLRRALSTVVRSLWPASFWRHVGLEIPARRWALVQFALVLLAFTHGVAAVSSAAMHRLGTVLGHLYSPWFWGAGPRRGEFSFQDWVWPEIWSPLLWPHFELPARWHHIGWSVPKPFLAGVWLCTIGVAACFVLVPTSMRRAKVRADHVMRAAVYSFVAVPLAIMLWSASELLNWSLYHVLPWQLWSVASDWIWLLAPSLLLLWSIVHWRCVVHSYFRMPHGAGVSLAMHAVCCFALATVGVVFWGDQLLYWFV